MNQMNQQTITTEAGLVLVNGHLDWIELALLVGGGFGAGLHFKISPAEACMVAGALQASVAQTPLDFSRGAVIGNVPDALDWANGVLHQDSGAGHFLKALAHAAQLADNENFPILLPALQVLMEKYPSYLEQERARR